MKRSLREFQPIKARWFSVALVGAISSFALPVQLALAQSGNLFTAKPSKYGSCSATVGPKESSGLYAGAAVSNVELSINGKSLGRKTGAAFHLGLRLHPSCNAGWKALRVTPHVAYAVTDFGGMDPKQETFAFSHLDFGADVSYRVASRLRIFAVVRKGKRTAEIVEDGAVLNLGGSWGTGAGGGFEIPVINRSGRGIEVGFYKLSGHFTGAERLDMPHDIPARSYSARMYYVGWSGSFTGIDLPWR